MFWEIFMIHLERCTHSGMWIIVNEYNRAFAWFTSYATAADTMALMRHHNYDPILNKTDLEYIRDSLVASLPQAQILEFRRVK